MDKETILLFRSITEDFQIQDSEIAKYIKWGNHDMQQALNYYYRKLQKDNQIKNNCFTKSKKTQEPIKSQTFSFTKQKVKEEEQVSQQFREEVTVFDKMKKASIKQKKTEEFIARVRQQYQLPIKGKRNSSDKASQMQKQEDDDYEVEEEYKCADYLGSVFNNSAEVFEDDSEEDVDEFDCDVQFGEQLKQKIQKIQVQTINLAEVNKQKFIRNNFPLKKTLSKSLISEVQVKANLSKPKTNQNNQTKFKPNRMNLRKPNTRNNTKTLPKFQMVQSPPKIQVKLQNNYKIFDNNKSSSTKKQTIHHVPVPNEVYVGEYFFQGFKTDTKSFPQGLEADKLVEYKYYMEPQKKTKAIKSKATQKLINMRICFQNSEICRVQDHQARIFVPLITQNMMRLEVFLFQLPLLINTFSKIKFRAKVFLKKKALTDPVVETFDGQSQEIVSIYKGIRDELTGLMERLNLQIKAYPLIKNKSKFAKNNQKTKKTIKDAQHFEVKALQFMKKEQQYAQRKKNDPFFKVKQINIADMMKGCGSASQSKKRQQQSTPPKIKQAEQAPHSEVKKKIIEINTIEQSKYAQLIDLYEENITPVYPKNNFKSELYHYQAVALAWMLKREGKGEFQDFQINPQFQEIHPLWTEYDLPEDQFGSKRSLYYNELTAQLSLIKPIMKNKCKGGILADEMGLGKTVMMTALIASGTEQNLKKYQAQNLVIVPLTLLSQWQSQIKKHSKNVSVICYYTSERHKIVEQLGRYNVVITTYGTISHQFTKISKFNKTGLYKYKWKRIILDEAHYIKGRIIQTSKAVYALEGQCRWCLTGTPIQNGLNDLFSLIHFIKYAPWSEFECWSKYIIKPHEGGDQHVYEVLRTLLKRVFLRRTKNSKDHNGKNIIQLPKKSSKIEVLEMSPKQRQFYDMIYESTKAKLDQLDKLGIITARYMQVLEILVKLRQVCCHPVLFKSVSKFITNPESFEAQLRKFIKKRQAVMINQGQESENYFEPLIEGQEEIRVEISQQTKKISDNFLKETIEKINKEQIQNCLICLDNVEDPVITSCLHIFCKACMIRQINESGTCATCRKRLTKDDFLHLPRENRFNVSLDSENFTKSTKMIALMQHIKQMQPDDKAVVFSQFLGMLDLLEHDFKKNKIRFVRMEGSTPQKERARIISQFSNNPQVKIFLVSLKTAGVGLNLVAANKVFLMDPWWNPGVQDQAIERVHRIGQKKQVQVIRFIMDKTIQTRMVQLNTQKKNLSQLVLSHRENEGQSKFDKLRYLMQKY